MATKTDFTEDEWETMRKGVTGAGVLVSIGDRDFTDTFGEVGALAKRLNQEREQSGSQLVRELSATHGTGFGLVASPKEVVEGTINALGGAVSDAATATVVRGASPAARPGGWSYSGSSRRSWPR